MKLQIASRKKSKLRLNLSGPSGSGKTYSALLMAKGLVKDWSKIAVIDTENGSASLYDHLGQFNVIGLEAPFTPERYIQAIQTCVDGGMECIIIDSTSHEWDGAGGCIEINEKLAQTKYKGNTWSAWSQTTPRHDAFVQKVLQCPVHVITCTRSKMETVMTDDKKVKKLGMKDIQRAGWEYEQTVSLNIDRDTHTASASKDRTEIFEHMDPFVISEKTGQLISDWCEKGIEPVPEINPISAAIAEIYLAENLEALQKIWAKYPGSHKAAEFVAAKDEMKAQLTPPVETADFYDTWQKAVDLASNSEELIYIWNQNKATCESDVKIKAMFTEKNKSFDKEIV